MAISTCSSSCSASGRHLGRQARQPDVHRVRASVTRCATVLDRAALLGPGDTVSVPKREHQQHAACAAAQPRAQPSSDGSSQPLRVVHDDDQRPHRCATPSSVTNGLPTRRVAHSPAPVGPRVWLVADRGTCPVNCDTRPYGIPSPTGFAAGPPISAAASCAQTAAAARYGPIPIALHQHASRHAGRRGAGTLVQIVPVRLTDRRSTSRHRGLDAHQVVAPVAAHAWRPKTPSAAACRHARPFVDLPHLDTCDCLDKPGGLAEIGL